MLQNLPNHLSLLTNPATFMEIPAGRLSKFILPPLVILDHPKISDNALTHKPRRDHMLRILIFESKKVPASHAAVSGGSFRGPWDDIVRFSTFSIISG